jgi:thiol-disulfide isomerase/thioredoxin
MRPLFRSPSCALLLALSLTFARPAAAQQPVAMKTPAPELQGIDEWINSKPLSLKDLKGKVVVVHFWTFGCINCIHNYPHYAGWHKDFAAKDVVVIGIHTPETLAEKKIDRVRKKVKDNRMKYPIAVDCSAKTWQTWGNRLWPSVYLIDRKGNVRYRWDGELNWKETKGETIMRKKIEELLAEKE